METDDVVVEDVAKELLPQGIKILIRLDNPEELTKGGIIIPVTVKQDDPTFTGLVVAIGDTVPKDCLTYKAFERNLRVLFGKYSGTEIAYKGQKFTIMAYTDIYCVINVEEQPSKDKPRGKDNRI